MPPIRIVDQIVPLGNYGRIRVAGTFLPDEDVLSFDEDYLKWQFKYGIGTDLRAIVTEV